MVPEQKHTPDASRIETHLRHVTGRWGELGQPVMLEVVHLTAEDKARVRDVARFSPDATGLSLAADHIAAMNAHSLNSYIVVNPVDATRPLRPGHRADGSDIVASFFQFADADTAEAADNIRNFVGPKCTFVVVTGTTPHVRPHVYWELDEPTRNLQAWSRIQANIAANLGTDKVIDPPRIMRVAGTINWPKPQKQAKGYVAEVTDIHIHDPDERPPVTSEQMDRAFQPRQTAPAHALQIDTGGEFAPALDRERATIQALSGQDWHNAVIRLVASYVARGLSDAEIHALTDPLTLAGYSVAETREEVQTAIDGARRKGWTPEPAYTPNFDHAPAPTPSDPSPTSQGWRVQTAADFTADFVAPEYIIDGIIQRGRIYTLTAPTGSGKTAAMLYAASCIATGTQFCAHEVEGGDVLFMAGENPDDVRARVIATLEFHKIDPRACRLHFIAGTFSIRSDMEKLRAECDKLPDLKLAVIDTFAAYFDGDDENSNAQALDFARLVRKIAAFPSKPAIIMPAHPVKNATKANLTPKGGSSLLNEVDGNLTLWNDGGIITMHWQGKFRGAEFEALTMELQRFESAAICDNQGRLIPTILAKPLSSTRALQIATENLSHEDKTLLSIETHPAVSIADRCVHIGLILASGKSNKSRMDRILKKLADEKLIRRFRTNWELTKDGERAVEMLRSGQPFAKEI